MVCALHFIDDGNAIVALEELIEVAIILRFADDENAATVEFIDELDVIIKIFGDVWRVMIALDKVREARQNNEKYDYEHWNSADEACVRVLREKRMPFFENTFNASGT